MPTIDTIARRAGAPAELAGGELVLTPAGEGPDAGEHAVPRKLGAMHSAREAVSVKIERRRPIVSPIFVGSGRDASDLFWRGASVYWSATAKLFAPKRRTDSKLFGVTSKTPVM